MSPMERQILTIVKRPLCSVKQKEIRRFLIGKLSDED